MLRHAACFLLLTGSQAIPTQCPDPTSKGCAKPNWPPVWAMRQSLYAYCYQHCPLDFFANHTQLGVFGGVVGVDHYWTQQGMP
jgi:hypothetical protein